MDGLRDKALGLAAHKGHGEVKLLPDQEANIEAKKRL